MIFTENKPKETKFHPMPIGVCPICDKPAEVIENTTRIPTQYRRLCDNEAYKHYVDENGITYVRKVKNPKMPTPQ